MRPAEAERAPAVTPAEARVTVVVITHDRRPELLHVLDRLAALPERPAVIVVDNASRDGSADAVAARHPEMRLIQLRENLGAFGRNVAVRETRTRYVAFCDDDCWWEPGVLREAADVLDRCPRLAAVTARILVEPGGREDPIVAELRDSPLPRPAGAPGPLLGSILAGASVLRVRAFRQVGGFEPRLHLGGEEELLSIDLAARGWWLCYLEQLLVHHQPSRRRDPHQRRLVGLRNTLWVAWLRRPARSALRRTLVLARDVPHDRISLAAFGAAVRGMPWVLARRRVVPAGVERDLHLLEAPQRASAARRYVS
jgi:GT2 family glycosyltransferase